ncbi:substrate-binding periplasmic protein [Shewanella glacialimarina]|uniref:substrate-binding periplasmic protein n=1 Tax=Shewanella glacialimarina TaxID=2590884 RepID=UPI001CF8E836|nr:transporter substrate-binding domain-containing protein [Shewanella glacialimarina]UCX03447.1 transporter substrate-binding domain-containing protein [Shewanella glacialimarina]
MRIRTNIILCLLGLALVVLRYLLIVNNKLGECVKLYRTPLAWFLFAKMSIVVYCSATLFTFDILNMRKLALLILVCFTLEAWATPGVRVEYRDKPPYTYSESGQPRGFIIDMTQEIFRRAGVAATYSEVPVKRIFANIQNDSAAVCSPSWYKLADRELYANFSLVIHKDRPHMVLVAPRVIELVKQHHSLSSLFGDPRLKLGVVAQVSYGPELDLVIASKLERVTDSARSVESLAKMVSFNHGADYMLIDREDYDYINRMGEISAMGLLPMYYSDMPSGLNRYLMCSKSVDAETMARLNQAIRELLPEIND